MATALERPEYNTTGQNYAERGHFTYRGSLIDIHTHVMLTRPGDPINGPPLGTGPGASYRQAETMLAMGATYGIVQTVTMCPSDDIPVLRERFGDQLLFNGMINKKKLDDPDEHAYRLLDAYLSQGVRIVKYWAAPRGRDRGLLVDAPWRIETTRRAITAGIKLFMVHVSDPDAWFQTMYADSAKFGTKADQYVGLERMLQMFPEVCWIGAHMGGDVEHPDHLAALLEKYPHFYLDTSATKWIVREASRHPQAVHELICRFPDRFLFGTDLVTRHNLEAEHYASRYWCQRTLWESTWQGLSPIADPDYLAGSDEPPTPMLRGVGLPVDVLEKVYLLNSQRLLAM